jgi:uncharacterized protein YodC (DUF2158 family)
MNKINKGDIVTLKSGGPDMVVEGINAESGDITCSWFMQNGILQRQPFFPGALVVKQNYVEEKTFGYN